MKIPKLVTALVLIAGLGFAAQAQNETPVDMKDLPAEAQTTIKEKAGNDQVYWHSPRESPAKGKRWEILVAGSDNSTCGCSDVPRKANDCGKSLAALAWALTSFVFDDVSNRVAAYIR